MLICIGTADIGRNPDLAIPLLDHLSATAPLRNLGLAMA